MIWILEAIISVHCVFDYIDLYIFRGQYDALKAVCQKMVPTVGSGKFITTPVVTDDGQPVPDPQNNTYAITNSGQLDQREIQWMLSLSQIGSCSAMT